MLEVNGMEWNRKWKSDKDDKTEAAILSKGTRWRTIKLPNKCFAVACFLSTMGYVQRIYVKLGCPKASAVRLRGHTHDRMKNEKWTKKQQ